MEGSKDEENTNKKEDKENTNKKEDKENKESTEEDAIANFDLSTPCWFYMDSNGLKQGPFNFKMLFLWWKGGYLPNELLVKTVWENDFQQLGNIPEFYSAPPKLIERIEKEHEELVKQGHIEVPMVPTVYEPEDENQAPTKVPKFEEYKVKGTFNVKTGKYQSENYFEAKGLPVDRDARMLSHYIDMNKYQQDINSNDKKKKKPVKGSKKFWKERKEKKRRAKQVAEWLSED